MHYSFKSTPTWSLKGRPESKNTFTQQLLLKINHPLNLGLLIIKLKSHFLKLQQLQLLDNKEIYINHLSQIQDLDPTKPNPI